MTTNANLDRREVDFDQHDQAYASDSSARFRELRDKCPVAHSPHYGGFWVLSRYEDVAAAARDPKLFSSEQGVSLPRLNAGVPLPPLETDPPRHAFFRQVLQPEFSRARMQQVEGFVRDLTREFMDNFDTTGPVDLIDKLVAPLPAIVIAHLMGFPREDWSKFREWFDVIMDATNREDPEAGQQAAMEFFQHIVAALDDRRLNPSDDTLTRIVSCEIDGRPVTDEEAIGMTWATIVAGHETTVGGIGALLMHVGQDSALKERLLEDRGLIPKAIQETIRLEAPVQGMSRALTRDVCLGGQQLLAGENVWLSFAAANRDDAEFEDPDSFDVDRSPNRHLGFGDGVHRCAGLPLAQLEMRVVLEEMLDRYPGFTLDPDAELRFHRAGSCKLLGLDVKL
ncbi:cytochrome P450 [Gordonia terrae]